MLAVQVLESQGAALMVAVAFRAGVQGVWQTAFLTHYSGMQ